MIATGRVHKADQVGVDAVDVAQSTLLELVAPADVGGHLGHVGGEDRLVTHFFECTRTGYRGWRWSVTVVRAARQKSVTIDEIVLLPGDDAITAPTWVPWRERIQPGDLGPGDLLPADQDDPRLAPGYTAADEIIDQDSVKAVSDELGLGRPRVLSLEGRELAAQRWYDGSHGPDAPIASNAPGTCGTCGFMTRLAGPLSQLFAVCANAYANDDGRVVSVDHGCGAHSDAQLNKRNLPQPLPEPVLDTLSWDELETF
ncbi:MAG TPA: DUF3027 domain-containing protein [Nocardioidaceae bacterium]|nr:DUF3027 domain-containing protein [Nocardioidaceae bacterium]